MRGQPLTVAKVTAANMLFLMISSKDTTRGMSPPLTNVKVTVVEQHRIESDSITLDLSSYWSKPHTVHSNNEQPIKQL